MPRAVWARFRGSACGRASGRRGEAFADGRARFPFRRVDGKPVRRRAGDSSFIRPNKRAPRFDGAASIFAAQPYAIPTTYD